MRIDGKGLIDRSAPLTFRFDGAEMQGFAGDTLASALLANGRRLVGRSFKYHRPRGIYAAGSEEPNALVTIGQGADTDPNRRATMLELQNGLTARSQNRWPSLEFDLLSVNDLAAPFLGAGFYYKTFMWPRAFWERVYEPFIRRAAGLGALDGAAARDDHDKAFAFCDLLVIGSGPTGLMAALAAGRAGADVILAEEDSRMGGRLLAEADEIGGKPGHLWAEDVLEELTALPNVRLMSRSCVTGAYDGSVFGALEQRAPGMGGPVETFWRIIAKGAVLAAGAIERGIAFRNNDRPGIMQAGAVRAYLNRWGVGAGRRFAVFSNNDNAHRTARDLQAAGIEVVAMIDSRPDAPLIHGVRQINGAVICDTAGRKAVKEITVATGTGEETLAVDCVAVSGGWNPTLHLTCHMNNRPEWSEKIVSFVPRDDMIPGLISAGACAGKMSTLACLQDGVAAAARVLGRDLVADIPEAEDDPYRVTPLWAVPGKGRAWLDFQNDVSVKDVQQAATENFRSVEHMKRYTTQGMATDQGKNSNIQALALLADATGRGIPETGTTTFRPPFSPVALASLGAGAKGKGFAPERKMTSHQISENMGAPMIAAGLWYRPSYFPKPGETTWRESCDREVGYVRNAVGICDVSTLGKIDIQGPDAAKLLDFVYTGMMSTLKPGRVRYGLMLREDGHVMDDGTCARLGAAHYLVTTTTAAAGQVMQHLEFVTQVLRPDWAVRFASVTEHWAQFAIAGPRAKDLLTQILGTAPDLPFMGCGAAAVGGTQGRLFRISFSGEAGFELAVPARYGESLFQALVDGAEAMGGGAYGMEALNVLRLEKGFITHAEIDGRVTAGDLGMGGMVSGKKDCIGKVMSQRVGLADPARPALVGLRAVQAGAALSAGAHLFDAGAEAVRVNAQGWVSSVCHSPTLGCAIGLGFVKNGRDRMGEVVRLVDHMRGNDLQVEIVPPVQFDPEGGRMRG